MYLTGHLWPVSLFPDDVIVTLPLPQEKGKRNRENKTREKKKDIISKKAARPGALENPVGKSYRPAVRI